MWSSHCLYNKLRLPRPSPITAHTQGMSFYHYQQIRLAWMQRDMYHSLTMPVACCSMAGWKNGRAGSWVRDISVAGASTAAVVHSTSSLTITDSVMSRPIKHLQFPPRTSQYEKNVWCYCRRMCLLLPVPPPPALPGGGTRIQGGDAPSSPQ